MSSDEESLALGRLVEAHRNARDKRILLEADLHRIGELLLTLGKRLTSSGSGSITIDVQIRSLPTAEKLLELWEEARETRLAENRLREQLNELKVLL